MTEPPSDNPKPDVDERASSAVEPASTPSAVSEKKPGFFNRQMHYPNAYTWLLLLSAMDVMLTWTIFYFGGSEINPVADAVIDVWGLNGMIIYKFVLILFFILICEIVGTLKHPTGKALSKMSVLIASVPVVWSLFLLARFSGIVG